MRTKAQYRPPAQYLPTKAVLEALGDEARRRVQDARMALTLIGKFVPIFLAVTLFVAGNFQHSPANAGYFALIMPGGEGPDWALALGWNLVPAAIGNILGAALLVALPFWYSFRTNE